MTPAWAGTAPAGERSMLPSAQSASAVLSPSCPACGSGDVAPVGPAAVVSPWLEGASYVFACFGCFGVFHASGEHLDTPTAPSRAVQLT